MSNCIADLIDCLFVQLAVDPNDLPPFSYLVSLAFCVREESEHVVRSGSASLSSARLGLKSLLLLPSFRGYIDYFFPSLPISGTTLILGASATATLKLVGARFPRRSFCFFFFSPLLSPPPSLARDGERIRR